MISRNVHENLHYFVNLVKKNKFYFNDHDYPSKYIF